MHRASLFMPPAGSANGVDGGGVTVLQMDAEVNEFSRLQAVGRRLDEMILGGTASLEALRHQG